MDMVDANFRIKAENCNKALKAIQRLACEADQMSGGVFAAGKQTSRHFSWVHTCNFEKAPTLDDAMGGWRWPVERDIPNDQDSDVVGIQFYGEKLGDDAVLFHAIAPFVEEGSWIEMRGEDSAMWRWVFRDGRLHEISPEIIWPE
jgi:hypothetical protein